MIPLNKLLLLLTISFGMMITSLNVVNVFTDEFDQVKAEGKSCCNFRVDLNFFMIFNRCDGDL